MKPFEQRAHHAITGRGVTLAMLMADGFIQPGNDTMSIDYLGQNFRADLLDGGRIRENGKVFGTPSAWAIHCKNIVNPGKKSGCGWASVKYKGKKLDAYKLSWLSKHRPLAIAAVSLTVSNYSYFPYINQCYDIFLEDIKPEIKLRPLQPLRPSVRHSTLGKKSSHHDPKTLVECVPFVALAKIQPFTISVSPFCLLVMDVQCHLSSTEVVGYLGGEWDHNRQHLSIQRAYPCLCRQKDPSTANEVEETIRYQMSQHGVQLAGWYHSHPKMQPDPSLNDIESQMDYQLQLRGSNNTYHPCVGFIVSPFEPWSSSPVSRIRSYWVMPPPENRPTDYGTPMFMEFNESQDSLQMENLLSELKKIVEFYRSDSDLMPLTDIWYGHITIAEKLRASVNFCFIFQLLNVQSSRLGFA
ncbi:hypothetical protein CAPTEDRAFT_110378 [Capitella teleta]|uniref:MPN domain-containing protein n=1 Tax=Capitella teleta TaxID=283909 RepID=R7TND3_CAPTE|nr:hypothetical protein CAPTEDRAFT_110378 [Capitella teleta]|eukprot:ELT95353.1 hypothetical protein CAPTEDRAFT_110378 [Capitella teleta]